MRTVTNNFTEYTVMQGALMERTVGSREWSKVPAHEAQQLRENNPPIDKLFDPDPAATTLLNAPGASDPMLQFFQYEHLPVELQFMSRPFAELARHLVSTLPRNPERTACLRKLMEAKDCAVRARLYKE